MSGRIHLVIPMSGQGTRYQKAGYHQPKPLIPVNGRPMIERLLEKCPIEWPTTFVLAENHRTTELPELLKRLRPDGKQIFIEPHQKGPSFALQSALPLLNDAPVLVSYCDYGLVWDPIDFERFVNNTACDAALVSYRGFHAHYLSPVPYAYSRLEGEFVREVKEKGSFTNQRENEFASCGAYFFKSPATLAHALETQERMKLALNGEYYTSLTVEALLQGNPAADVRVYEIPAFFQWGTPEDLAIFEYWERTFLSKLRHPQPPGTVAQVLMPMAGLGSRFSSLFKTPKPFLKLGGTPMFRRALQSLPRAKKTRFVALNSCQEWIELRLDESVQLLSETPAGQALSVEAGLDGLDDASEIIVSSCDHEVVLDPEVWQRFSQQSECDAAIFTIRNFPGTRRSPNSFAYVQTIGEGEFKTVSGVSVKKPLSETPWKDELLVGTFWFKNKRAMKMGIEELIKKDLRVNGEIYLDSVFNLLINAGLSVRSIPLDGYINLGDPDSLAESLYWNEVFSSRKERPRGRFEGVTG